MFLSLAKLLLFYFLLKSEKWTLGTYLCYFSEPWTTKSQPCRYKPIDPLNFNQIATAFNFVPFVKGWCWLTEATIASCLLRITSFLYGDITYFKTLFYYFFIPRLYTITELDFKFHPCRSSVRRLDLGITYQSVSAKIDD